MAKRNIDLADNLVPNAPDGEMHISVANDAPMSPPDGLVAGFRKMNVSQGEKDDAS